MKIEKFNLDKQNLDVTLTAYLLDDSPEMLNGKPRPGIIICPGGGFFNCSDREAEPVAMYLVNLGYDAFVLRYTTYFSGSLQMPDLSKPLPVNTEKIYPKQIRELGQAMLLVRKNAKKWKVDPNKVGICGFSAGGHVAALYATRFNEPVLKNYFQVDSKYLRPAVVVIGYALTDYHFLDNTVRKMKSRPMDYNFMKASNVAYLGTEFPSYSLEEKVSPVNHVDSDTPPFFIWATATDPLVSPIHSLKMAKALAENKIPYEIHLFGEGGHGLSLASQATAQSKTQIEPIVSVWTELCSKWLEKNLPISLPKADKYESEIRKGEIE